MHDILMKIEDMDKDCGLEEFKYMMSYCQNEWFALSLF